MARCMKLGVYGKHVQIPLRLCQNQLHWHAHPHCRECRYLKRMRHYYAVMLQRYWTEVLT